MPLTLVTIEHSEHTEVLRHPAASVAFPLSEVDQQVIAEMKILLEKLKGVGLAAPQVGIEKKILIYTISEQAKALRQDAKETVPSTVLINASYRAASDAKIVHDWEGCFSVMETTGKVPRYDKIFYTAQDETGKKIEGSAEGFTARVLQHEIDHTEGLLILDRLSPECIQGHPDEMSILRFKEFNPTQKEIIKKMIAEQESSTLAEDTIRTRWIAKTKLLLDK